MQLVSGNTYSRILHFNDQCRMVAVIGQGIFHYININIPFFGCEFDSIGKEVGYDLS